MKLYNTIIATVLGAMLLGGCAADKKEEESKIEQESVGQEKVKEEEGFPITIDLDGESLVIEKKPEKILPLSLDVAEIVLELVDPSKIVAITKGIDDPFLSTQAEKASEIKERIASATNIDPEQILSYETDLLLLTKMHGQEADANKVLSQAGIPILTFETINTVERLMEHISIIGKAIGEEDKAETVISKMKEEITESKGTIPENAKESTVLVLSELGPGTGPYIMGPGNISYDIIKLAGGIPAVNRIQLDRSTKASVEQVIKMDPDYIFLLDWHGNGEESYEELINTPGWNTLTAAQEKNIKVVEAKYLLNPNTKVTHGLQVMIDWIYGQKE